MPNLNFAEAFVFSVEEELLCKTQSCSESVMFHGYFFYISIDKLYLVF